MTASHPQARIHDAILSMYACYLTIEPLHRFPRELLIHMSIKEITQGAHINNAHESNHTEGLERQLSN